MPSAQSVDWYRKQAKQQYHREGTIEIDDRASVSKNDSGDDGAYVQAWVWVADPPKEE